MLVMVVLSRIWFDLELNKVIELFLVNYELVICCNENNVLIS